MENNIPEAQGDTRVNPNQIQQYHRMVEGMVMRQRAQEQKQQLMRIAEEQQSQSHKPSLLKKSLPFLIAGGSTAALSGGILFFF